MKQVKCIEDFPLNKQVVLTWTFNNKPWAMVAKVDENGALFRYNQEEDCWVDFDDADNSVWSYIYRNYDVYIFDSIISQDEESVPKPDENDNSEYINSVISEIIQSLSNKSSNKANRTRNKKDCKLVQKCIEHADAINQLDVKVQKCEEQLQIFQTVLRRFIDV